MRMVQDVLTSDDRDAATARRSAAPTIEEPHATEHARRIDSSHAPLRSRRGEKAVTEHVVLINRPGPAEHRTHNTAGVRFRPIGVEGPLDVAAEICIEAS